MSLQQPLAVLLRDMDDLLVPHFLVDTITENENAKPPNIDVTVNCGEPSQIARDCVDILALRMECAVEWEAVEDEQWTLVFTPKECS